MRWDIRIIWCMSFYYVCNIKEGRWSTHIIILDKVKMEEVVQDIFCQNAIISGDE